jgi:hypothetical protein
MIDNYVAGRLEPRELAMQIADIITLRPEIQLCYVGILTKCFEILESPDGNCPVNGASTSEGGTIMSGSGAIDTTTGNTQSGDGAGELDTSEDDDDEDDVDDDDEETEEEDGGDDDDDGETPTGALDPDETQSEDDGGDNSDDDSFVEDPASQMWLRLREILFYDDKVAIFKARHGKL